MSLRVYFITILACQTVFEGYMNNGLSMAIMRILRRIQITVLSIYDTGKKETGFNNYIHERTEISIDSI